MCVLISQSQAVVINHFLDNADCIAKDLVGANLIDGRNLVVGMYLTIRGVKLVIAALKRMFNWLDSSVALGQ